MPSAVRMRPTVAFEIIRPRASGLSSPLASVIGPSPKNSVRPEPANVSTCVVPSASVPDLKVPAPLTVTTPAMFSSRSETETENVSPSAAPKETVSVRPLTSTLWSTAPPVVFTRKRMRPLICTPPVANAALPVRKPAMPSVLSTRTPSPSLQRVLGPDLDRGVREGHDGRAVLALVEEGAGERALGERGGERALGAAQALRRVDLQARVGERGREAGDAFELRAGERAGDLELAGLLLERERAGRGQARAGGLADAEARQREREVRAARAWS